MQALPPASRRVVRGIAALLRVADALDRTHFGVVAGVRVARTRGRLAIVAETAGESAELELWAAERRVDLLSRLLDRPITFRATTTRRVPERRIRAAR